MYHEKIIPYFVSKNSLSHSNFYIALVNQRKKWYEFCNRPPNV